MWNSIHKFGYTKEKINEVVKELLKENPRDHCPDCGVLIGENHIEECDVAQCSICGKQRLGCGCQDGDGGKWDGFWPGTKDALEQQFICCWNDSKKWMPDFNELAIKNQEKNNENNSRINS